MRKTRLAINGFGRIGRNAFKIAFNRPDIEVVAINDLADVSVMANLLKHDSTYGTYASEVKTENKKLVVDDQDVFYFSEPDPSKLEWKSLAIDVVLECTGRFADAESAGQHLQAGAKRVLISAPAKGGLAKTIVLGVNEAQLQATDKIVSNASCTTNCIAPVMAVLDEAFGIEKGVMTTIHSYTINQVVLDSPARDLRMARTAATNIIPTTTGASKAVAEVLPSLGNCFGGLSVRVPTPAVSLSDFALVMKRDLTVKEVNTVLKKAARSQFYQGILDVTDEALVSTDFIGNPASSIVDLSLTTVVGGNLLKVVAWYDNEWAYANRLVELAIEIGNLIGKE